MLMIDLDNTGRVLEYTHFIMENAIQCQLFAISMSQTLVNTDDICQQI